MLLKKTIVRTRKFFQKTLQDFKSLFCKEYQKLPKSALPNPFCCTTRKTKNNQTAAKDRYYTNFCNEWENDLEKVRKTRDENKVKVESKEEINVEDEDSLRRKMKEREKQEKVKTENIHQREMEGEGYELAQKMKQLDMTEISDVEHVLDIEEALHYYSRLKSPVYRDIVDKFFVDMYSEFSTAPQPQASVGVNKSRRRLGSIRL